MFLDFLYPALFLLAFGCTADFAEAAKPKNAILLSQVQSLTLRADQQTSHRRVPAAPQLKCISPRAICALHKVDTMRCVNQGAGYSSEDIQWSCTASLPGTLKLGSTDVICEGYASADDEYVLKGSCGVEYRLVLTDEGERLHPELSGGGSGFGGGGSWSSWLFWTFFLAVLVFILWSACYQQNGGAVVGAAGAPRPRRGWGGGGGGGAWGPGWGGGGGGAGGWDHRNDPPPPYPGTKRTADDSWRPGFWSGLAGGTAAGYWAGSRATDRNRMDNMGMGTGGWNTGSWGGGGGGSTWGGPGGAGPSRSSASTERHDSTGFGSTRRR